MLERLGKLQEAQKEALKELPPRPENFWTLLAVCVVGASLWAIVIAIESGDDAFMVLLFSAMAGMLAATGLCGPPGASNSSNTHRSDRNHSMWRWLRRRRKLVPRIVLNPLGSLVVLFGFALLHSWMFVSFGDVTWLYAALYALPAAVSSLFWLVAIGFVLEGCLSSRVLCFCALLIAVLMGGLGAVVAWEHGAGYALGRYLLGALSVLLLLFFVLDWMRALSARLFTSSNPRSVVPEMRPCVVIPPRLLPIRGVVFARGSEAEPSATDSASSALCIAAFGRTERGWIADASCTPMMLRTDDGVEMAIDTRHLAIRGQTGRSTNKAAIAALESLGLRGPFEKLEVHDLRPGDRVKVLGTVEESTQHSGYRESVAVIRGEPVFVRHDGAAS